MESNPPTPQSSPQTPVTPPPQAPTRLFQFQIAGVQHAQYQDAITAGLTQDEELSLIPEPENQYDNLAVRVQCPRGYKLGYVPRKETELQKLIHGVEGETPVYKATLGIFNPEEVTYRMFTVLVEI